MRFLDILVVFRLDLDQINFNLVKGICYKTDCPSCHQHRVLRHAFLTWACAENKILRSKSLGFSIFEIFFLSFFSFAFRFAAVIDLLLGLLAVKYLLRKRHQDRQFLPWSRQVQWHEISLNVLSIFVHVSGSIWPITLIWASFKKILSSCRS